MRVILQRRAAFDKALAGAHQASDINLRRHGLRQEQRVGGQIAQHVAGADKFRVHPPAGAGVILLYRLVMETVGELHIDDADLAQQPLFNHLPRLQNQLMPGIAVGDTDDFALFFAQGHQRIGLFAGKTERFFADHMQSGLQRRAANGVVGVVWRGDGDRFNAVFPRRLFAKQRFVVGVTAPGLHAQLLAKLAPALGVNIKGSGKQGKRSVTQRRRAVNIANLAASAAAHHAPAQGAANRFNTVNHVFSPD